MNHNLNNSSSAATPSAAVQRAAAYGAGGLPTVYWRTVVLTLCVATLLIRCIGTYDPFDDLDNAVPYTEYSSFADGDTVNLFFAETLLVKVQLKEHTDSLRFFAPGNRLWSNGDTVLYPADFVREPFLLQVSLCDTGQQHLVTTVFLDNSTTRSDTTHLYGRLALEQQPLTGEFGLPLALATPPVGDPGVTYHWSFGAGTEITADTCSTIAAITVATAANRGELWVSVGEHRSPSARFAFSLSDTVAPQITCLAPVCHGDTVFTSDTVFDFAVQITDRGSALVDSVSINGTNFTYASGTDHHRIFTAMHLYPESSPLSATVFALDHFAFGNTVARTFTLVFSDSVPAGASFTLSVTSPAGPEGISTTGFFTLAGTIVTARPLPAAVRLTSAVNGIATMETIGLLAVVTPWLRLLTLPDTLNDIELLLTDTAAADTFALVHRTIRVVPAGSDTTGPVIDKILVDGSPADGYFSRRSLVLVRAHVTDEASTVGSVTINGTPAVPDTGGWYQGNIELTHRSTGSEITVDAIDTYGNGSSRTAQTSLNRQGLFLWRPASAYLVVDSLYHDTVAGVDPDGDTIRFDLFKGPASMTITQEGGVYWMPSDTGRYAITARLWDGYEPSYITWSVYVSPAGMRTRTLRFATTEDDFPHYLDAQTDTLKITLRALSGTGVPPLRYTVLRSGADSVLLSKSLDSLLQWAPSAKDSGWQQFIAYVRDDFGGRDTIYPRIFVTVSNHPCSLSVEHALAVRSDSSLDLNAASGPAQLIFRIHDTDPPVTERHTIVIRQSRSGATTVIDSAQTDTFSVALDPSGIQGYDTLTATVRDRGNTTDTVRLVLYYGWAPAVPVLIHPQPNAIAVPVPTSFAWSGTDPDNDTLTFSLIAGTSPDSLLEHYRGTDTTVMLPGLLPASDWYWAVDAIDRSGITRSPVRHLTTAP